MGGILYVHTYWNEPEQVLTGKQEHSKRDQHVQKTHPLNCEKVIVSDRRLQKSKIYIQKHHGEVVHGTRVYMNVEVYITYN